MTLTLNCPVKELEHVLEEVGVGVGVGIMASLEPLLEEVGIMAFS